MRNKIIVGLFLVLLSWTTLMPRLAQAQATAHGSLIINLSTDDTWKAATAMRFAQGAIKTGHHVMLLLTAQGVRWADKKAEGDTTALNGKTNEQMLEQLLSQGAEVVVCPPCLKAAGVSEKDLAQGVKLGSAETIFPKLFENDVRTMSW